MSAVRAYWRWCIDMGYTKNDPFRKYSVGSQKYGTPYYLTTEERDLLYKTDMGDDKDLRTACDIFVFQCYIGCRISDLLSFTYNVGTGNLARSTLLRKVKANPKDPSIRGEFSRWVYGGGKRRPGLVRRRRVEAGLFFS